MRKSNAKDRILETAGRLFFQRGYSEVGINEIIEKAETAKASFYQHFRSKEALCEAWLSHVHDRSEDSRKEIIAAAAPATEKISGYFDELVAFMESSDFRGCPYSNTSAVSGSECTGILAQIRGHKESLRRFFRELAGQAVGKGENADLLGDQILILYSGAATECQNLRETWPAVAARDAALELITR